MAPGIATMPFGKHRGRPLAEVPVGYLKWCLREMTDLYPATRASIQAVVNGGQASIPGTREPGDESADVVACLHCGGSAAGRQMVHVECAGVLGEVPF